MIISAIHVYQHMLPVQGPAYTMSHSQVCALDTTIVEVVTNTGLSGFGETCPVGPIYQQAHAQGARAAIGEIAPHLLGLDPCLIEAARRRMDGALNGHNDAKAAFDTALWDLLGQATGMRVCDLLGGTTREAVPSYYAVNVGSPDDTVRIAQDRQGAGFQRLQFKIGGRDIEEDIEVVRRVFEVKRAGVRIALNANRSLTTRDLLQRSSACRELPFVLEQPCETIDEIASVKPNLHHPVCLDEETNDLNIVMAAIYAGVADGFGMKLTRLGGISTMRAVRDVCQATRRPISCDDSWGGGLRACWRSARNPHSRKECGLRSHISKATTTRSTVCAFVMAGSMCRASLALALTQTAKYGVHQHLTGEPHRGSG